jgi:hypothetical protein
MTFIYLVLRTQLLSLTAYTALYLRYKDQSFTDLRRNLRCLFCESCRTHEYILWAKSGVSFNVINVARMGEKRNAYRILVGKPEGRRPLGRPRRRWVDNIKMGHREIGRDGLDWIDLAQCRDHWRALVNTVMNLRVP